MTLRRRPLAFALGTVLVVLGAVFFTAEPAAAAMAVTVTSVSPKSAPANSATTITVHGSGFVSPAKVYFGGRLATNVTVSSSTTLAVTTPLVAAQVVSVRVVDHFGSSATGAASAFSFVTGPVLISVMPHVASYTGGSVVDIAGSGLSGLQKVYFGGAASPQVSVLSSTMVRAVLPANSVGPAVVRVVTSSGASFSSRLSVNYLNTTASMPPAAPTLLSASSLGRGLQVAWQPSPANDDVSGYRVTATPLAGSSSPDCAAPAEITFNTSASNTLANVPNACAGIAYTTQVSATNAFGTGAASVASAPVVPEVEQVPNTPLISSVLARNGSLLVSWSSSSYDGGSAITGYQVDVSGDVSVTQTAASTATSAMISGLTNGRDYSISLTAVNAIGPSDASTGDGTPEVEHAPTSPSGLSVVPDGHGNVLVSWQPPSDNGGSPVAGYTVSYSMATQVGGAWSPSTGATTHTLSTAADTTSATATTFEDRNAFYTFTVSAFNTDFTGAAVSTANPISPTFSADDTTVVLSSATVARLSGVTDASLSWVDPAPAQVKSLIPGDSILAAPGGVLPEGTLRYVTGLSDNGTQTTVSTVQGSISQAFNNLSIGTVVNPVSGLGSSTSATSSSGVKSTAAPAKFVPDVGGIHVSDFALPGVNFSTTVSLDVNGTLQSGSGCDSDSGGGKCIQTKISGGVDITPSVSLSMEVHQNIIGIPTGASLKASAKVDASANLQASVTASYSKQIGELVGAPIDAQIGPFPLVLEPKVPVFVVVSGDAAVGVTTTVTVGGALSWDSSNPGTITGTNLSTPPKTVVSQVPGVGATGDVTVGVHVQPQIDLYGVAGPNVEADLDMKASIDFDPAPGDPFITLGPVLTVKAGVDIDAFDGAISASDEITIATQTFASITINDAPTPSYNISAPSGGITPGQPVTFTATRTDGANEPLTWSLLGQVTGDSITSGGLFTAANPQGRSVVIQVKDSDGVTGKATVNIGTPFDAPGNLSVAQAAGVPNSATATWTAPSRTGNGTIASYRVVTTPATSTHTVTTPRVTLTGLPVGSDTVSVYAINSLGVASAPATALITVNQDGSLIGVASAGWAAPTSIANNAQLMAVSCVTTSFCMAVGTGADAIEYNGTKWLSAVSVVPNDTFETVSCTSPMFCMAGSYTGLTYRFNGSAWSYAGTPDPQQQPYNIIHSISCASPSMCIAGDWLGNVMIYNGSSWSAPQHLNPETAVLGNSAVFVTLDCVSTTWCMATDNDGLSAIYNGSSWSVSVASSNPFGYSSSCTSTSYCIAIDNAQGGQPGEIVRWNGTSWTILSSSTTGVNTSAEVSCVSTTFCMGVDGPGLREVFDGTQWYAGSTLPPLQSNQDSLEGVSCVSSTFCVAVGWNSWATIYSPASAGS